MSKQPARENFYETELFDIGFDVCVNINHSKLYNRYGTTLRTFDRQTGKWTINWFNPVSGIHNELYARAEPGKIIQETKEVEGLIMRWVFNDIKINSFHWYGEGSVDHGKTWTREVEFFASKML